MNIPKPVKIKPVVYGAVENLITGLGAFGSKSRQWIPTRTKSKRNYNRLIALYEESIARQIIDLPIDDVFSGDPLGLDPSEKQFYSQVSAAAAETWKMARLFGCAWLMNDFSVITPNVMLPDIDDILITFTGLNRATYQLNADIRYKYESVLTPVYDDIRLYEATKAAIFETIGEFAMIQMRIPNLMESTRDAHFNASMQALAQVKAVTGIIPIDATGGLEIVTYQYDQILQVLAATEDTISAGVGIPKAVLFQRSPSGSTSGRFEVARFIRLIENLSKIWVEKYNLVSEAHGMKSRLTTIDHTEMLALYEGVSSDPNNNTARSQDQTKATDKPEPIAKNVADPKA